MSDSFVQVQPDGPGKQLDTELVQTEAGNLIYTQRVRATGDLQDMIQQLYALHVRQLNVLLAINANLQMIGGFVDENDFTPSSSDSSG